MEHCTDCNIVFDERVCPLCVAQTEIKTLEDRIEKLEEELDKSET